MTSKAVSDIRATSYDAATANADGYTGTTEDALAQIRAEDDVQPFPISARTELLMFLGVMRPVKLMSGIQKSATNVEVTKDLLARMARIPEDDSVVYGVPHGEAAERGFYTLGYAMQRWPENFEVRA
jgi:hypothetical protein